MPDDFAPDQNAGRTNPFRWISTITYRTKHGPVHVTHYFEEIEDLHDIVARGPDWNTIIKIETTINPKYTTHLNGVSDLRRIPTHIQALEQRLAESYQAVGMLGETIGCRDDPHFIRLQDVLSYGKPQDGGELLPFPVLANVRADQAGDRIASLETKLGEAMQALKSAQPILERVSSGVFNDNFDLTVCPPPNPLTFDDYVAAFWADRRARAVVQQEVNTPPHPTNAAHELAELVLSMGMVTDKGLAARDLARRILGLSDDHPDNAVVITTNGTSRTVPADEPVFLIRAQDIVGGAAVRAWANLAEAAGASRDILDQARAQASKMEAWPRKKVPDATETLCGEAKSALKAADRHRLKEEAQAPRTNAAAQDVANVLEGYFADYGQNPQRYHRERAFKRLFCILHT